MTSAHFDDPRLQDPAMRSKAEKALEKVLWQKAFDAAEAEVAEAFEVTKQLPGITQRLERLESRPAKADVTLHQPKPATVKPTQNVPKMIEIIAGAAVAEIVRRGHQKDPTDTIKEAFPGPKNEMTRTQVATYLKAATSTATTTEPGWASELTANVTGAFWSDLENASIAAALLSRGYARPVDFNGSNSINVPYRDPTAKIPAAWVGENATIPVDQSSFLSVSIQRFKKGLISVVSEELIYSTQGMAGGVIDLVSGLIAQDTGESVDADLLGTDPGVAGVRPAGLMNGAPTQASAGATVDNVLADLAWLRSQMSLIRAQRPVLVLHPDRLTSLRHMISDGVFPFRADIDGGTLGGLPFIESRNSAPDAVTVIDGNRVYLDLGVPTFAIRDGATLVMADDDGVAPTMADTNAVTSAGSIKISDAAGAGATVKNLFQQYSVGIRLVQPMTWQSVGIATAQIQGAAW
ncbi:MAG: phage major capsid protein [Tateyamaria sp.]|uniref:phage major capsid protein n=1 Tax=Tateyamaria sp. TaxID=1929288 RepID=UPI00329EEFE5